MPAKCEDCQSDPAQKEYWGCDGNSRVKWMDLYSCDVFHCCPIRFISPSVIRFVDEYEYTKQFPGTARKYREQTQKYIDGITYYEAALAINMKAANGRNHGG